MAPRRGERPSWQDEARERGEIGVEPVDFVFEPSDLRLRYRQPRASGAPAFPGRGEIGARVEQVYASELDALRANKTNVDPKRKVRFLPYGIAVSVLDDPEEPT